MEKKYLTEVQFNKLIECKNKGLTSKASSVAVPADLELINQAWDYKRYIEYKKGIGLTLTDEEQLRLLASRPSILPARIGYFASLISQKEEENSNLRETRDVLVLQLKALRKTVDLLEYRKNSLQDIISQMETYIKKGSGVADLFVDE